MRDESALDNLADYTKLKRVIFLLSNIYLLDRLAENGNQTAQCISIDLKEAMKHPYLTTKQRMAMVEKYIKKENNQQIAEKMGISEGAVRKHLRGAHQRIVKILNNVAEAKAKAEGEDESE